MTANLALDARNWLAQQPEVTSLLGSDEIWATWIFANESPHRRIENTQKCAVVIFVQDAWAPANGHNTLSFPRLFVDVWADPTRASDNSVSVQDAKDKIHSVYKAVDKYLHTLHRSTANGGAIRWGTAAEITDGSASIIVSSERLDGYPALSPVADGNGAWMGRVAYGVTI